LIRLLLGHGYIPVISPLGRGADGTYNINADLAAGGIASALGADHLIFLSDVPGILAGGRTLNSLNPRRAQDLVAHGAISGGMIPKVQAAFDTLQKGVGSVRLIDGTQPHALHGALCASERGGTRFLRP